MLAISVDAGSFEQVPGYGVEVVDDSGNVVASGATPLLFENPNDGKTYTARAINLPSGLSSSDVDFVADEDAEQVELHIVGISQEEHENLSPFFSREFFDTDYWASSSADAVQDGGWLELDGIFAGTVSLPAMEPGRCTLMVESDSCTVSGMSGTALSFGSATASVSGVEYVPCTSSGSAGTFSFEVSGTSPVRLSLYNGTYSGDFIPYTDDHNPDEADSPGAAEDPPEPPGESEIAEFPDESWIDYAEPDVEISIEALNVAAASSQHFYTDDNGAHVSTVVKPSHSNMSGNMQPFFEEDFSEAGYWLSTSAAWSRLAGGWAHYDEATDDGNALSIVADQGIQTGSNVTALVEFRNTHGAPHVLLGGSGTQLGALDAVLAADGTSRISLDASSGARLTDIAVQSSSGDSFDMRLSLYRSEPVEAASSLGESVEAVGAVDFPLQSLAVHGMATQAGGTGPIQVLRPVSGNIVLQVSGGSSTSSTPIAVGDIFLAALPNGTADVLSVNAVGVVTILKRVGYSNQAETDGVTGTVGEDVISSTGAIEDGADVYYALPYEETAAIGSITVPVISDGDTLSVSASMAPAITAFWATRLGYNGEYEEYYNVVGDPDASYNSTWNSLGIFFRNAKNFLISLTENALAFYDGQGNDESNIVASFGRSLARIGRKQSGHADMTKDGLTVIAGDGGASLAFIGADMTQKSSYTESHGIDYVSPSDRYTVYLYATPTTWDSSCEVTYSSDTVPPMNVSAQNVSYDSDTNSVSFNLYDGIRPSEDTVRATYPTNECPTATVAIGSNDYKWGEYPMLQFRTPGYGQAPYTSKMWAIDQPTPGYGHNVFLNTGGNLIVGGGEFANNMSTQDIDSCDGDGESTYVGADGIIRIYSNCNTIANRKQITYNANGNLAQQQSGCGFFLVDSDGFQYPAAHDNGTNLWIGASSTASQHHKGGTYISSGHSGTAGYQSIKICVPNAANNGGTNYNVYHEGFKPELGDLSGTVAAANVASLPASKIGSGTLGFARGGTNSDGVDTVTTVSSIISAASGTTITGARYSSWGKVATLAVTFTRSSAWAAHAQVQVGTVVSGKRPTTQVGGGSAGATAGLATGGAIYARNTTGASIAAGTATTIGFTYLLP